MSELLATLIGEPPLSKMNPPNTKGGSFVSQLGSFAKNGNRRGKNHGDFSFDHRNTTDRF